MSSRVNKNHYRSKCPKWRKSKLGKTKPNGRYLASEVKRTHDDFVNRWGPFIKERNPAHYYSLINRPLPKKYQKPSYPIAPVNAYVPPQSKLSYEELQKQMDEERRIKKEKEEKALQIKREKEKEAERLRIHREAVARERRIIFPCNAHDNHRWTSIHSEAYQRKYNKKYEYY